MDLHKLSASISSNSPSNKDTCGLRPTVPQFDSSHSGSWKEGPPSAEKQTLEEEDTKNQENLNLPLSGAWVRGPPEIKEVKREEIIPTPPIETFSGKAVFIRYTPCSDIPFNSSTPAIVKEDTSSEPEVHTTSSIMPELIGDNALPEPEDRIASPTTPPPPPESSTFSSLNPT
jgi:hypothetical protein